jgi:hypothetical protein
MRDHPMAEKHVMAGPDPAILFIPAAHGNAAGDGRVKPGHDVG